MSESDQNSHKEKKDQKLEEKKSLVLKNQDIEIKQENLSLPPPENPEGYKKAPLPIILGDGVFTKDKIKIFSWDVGGFEVAIKYESVRSYILDPQFDIKCITDLKLDQYHFFKNNLDIYLPKDYYKYFNFCTKYCNGGQIVLSKVPPLKVSFFMENHQDNEGRLLCLEYEKFVLVSVSVPSSGEKNIRLKYRTTQWDPALRVYLENLKKQGKPVLIGGNFNVAFEEIDISNPATGQQFAGFLNEERKQIYLIKKLGFIDTFRKFHELDIKYTIYKKRQHRKTEYESIGQRYDYFFASDIERVLDSTINVQIEGSDHAPIELQFLL